MTFPRSIEDIPEFTDYSMKGRTYRYLEKEPLYPFGFGLSYSQFEYNDLQLSRTALGQEDAVDVSVTVKNAGSRRADEVVQLYVKDLDASCVVPHHSLQGFERVMLLPGEARRISFTLTSRELSLIDERGHRVLEPGRMRVSVGGGQPDSRSVALMGREPLSAELEVVGPRTQLPY
jgi:beta-glucosidase